jgi:murein DD-endopeptidase MepM/ murein hydrolase activator NlpD
MAQTHIPPTRRGGATAVVAIALVLALALEGCARRGSPAPVLNATPGQPANDATNIGLAVRPDSIIVQPGETLYSVSRRYAVPLRSLIEANNLQPPYGLVSGRRLILPQVRTYTVQPGDTLLNLSRRFGVDASTLARTNEIQPPFPVKLGQVLILPPAVQTATQAPTPTTAAAPRIASGGASATVTAEPLAVPAGSPRAAGAPVAASPPAVGRPAAGRTSPAPVTQPPAIQSAEVPPLPPGTVVRPPRVPPAAASVPSTAAASSPTAVAPVAPSPATSPPSEAPPPAVASVAPPSPEPPALEPLPEPSPGGHGFAWPVRGPVLVRYGPGANGTQNDGINIAAALGTPVLAASDGVVAYAGNELRGFGNLILLKHADGWTTAYAHCESISVKRGDRVKRGQPIARVGATGAVSEPQLHFELRRGTRALDPQSYLPPVSTASAG